MHTTKVNSKSCDPCRHINLSLRDGPALSLESKGRAQEAVHYVHVKDHQCDEDPQPRPLAPHGKKRLHEGVEHPRAYAEVVVVLGVVSGVLSGMEHQTQLLQRRYPGWTTVPGSVTHAVAELAEVCHQHFRGAQAQCSRVDSLEEQ